METTYQPPVTEEKCTMSSELTYIFNSSNLTVFTPKLTCYMRTATNLREINEYVFMRVLNFPAPN